MYSLPRLTCALLALLAGFSTSNFAHAGAWTQAEGQGLLIMTHSYYRASEFINDFGKRQSQPLYQKFEINPYLEYGITDRLTAGASLSLQYLRQNASTSITQILSPTTQVTTTFQTVQHNVGIGDSELFLRSRLWQQDGFVLSAEPMVKLPALVSYTRLPDIGRRQVDTGLTLSGGYGFNAYGLNHFANLDAGYRYRFGREKDQVRIGATLGIGLAPQWTLMPQLFITQRTSSPSASRAFIESPANDYNLFRLQLSAIYRMWNETSVQLGGFYHIHGRNTGTGGGVLLALWEPF